MHQSEWILLISEKKKISLIEFDFISLILTGVQQMRKPS